MTHDQTYHHIYIAGIKDKPFDITVSNGRFTSVAESSDTETCLDGESKWIAPGFVDLHLHLAWTDFDSADQAKRAPQEIERLQAQAFEATLRTGVTTVRDAGGLLPDASARLAQKYNMPLSVTSCGAMLGASDAKGSRYLQQRIDGISHSGAKWIKIFATGGLGSPAEKVLDPLFSKEEFVTAVRSAHAHHMKVMVHTWGGATLDWVIEAGADTVEHGVFLTADQAALLAQHRIPLIPTTAIYRIAADPHGAFALPEILCERAARAADAHQTSVLRAKRAGVQIGFGTDFATPALHGLNLDELDTLVDCGLTRMEAWQAATVVGRQILTSGKSGEVIRTGGPADAVLYNADPLTVPNAEALRNSMLAVIKGTAQFRAGLDRKGR